MKKNALLRSVALAGIIVFLIGIYFWIFRAGLPYQDPTTEMTIRWMAYNFAGETCLLCGAVISMIGVIGLICCKWVTNK